MQKLESREVAALDPYKFMALIGKRVIHPGGRASTEALLDLAGITPAVRHARRLGQDLRQCWPLRHQDRNWSVRDDEVAHGQRRAVPWLCPCRWTQTSVSV